MPASYAHYRFGQQAFPLLPEEARRTVQRFRRLYNVGLHGPDLFFYFQPFFHTNIGELGHVYHGLSGQEFFQRAVERLRENPSEGAEAYLYGVLGHYMLDAACHPMIREATAEGKIGHTELETEFDRHLLTLDGEESPHTRNLGRHMRLTWGEAVTVASFYPPAGAFAIRRCAITMAAVNRVLAMKNRKLLEAAFRLGGASAAQMVMYPRANHKCAHLLPQLCEQYDRSLERYPAMAAQLHAYIRENEPLGTDFEVTFG